VANTVLHVHWVASDVEACSLILSVLACRDIFREKRVVVRGPAHTCVIAGLRAGVLPEASRRGIVGLDVVSHRNISRGPYTYGPVRMSKDVLTDVLVHRRQWMDAPWTSYLVQHALCAKCKTWMSVLLEIELWGCLVSLVSQVPSDYSNLYRQLDTTSSNFY
jgi:hypothetical protein